MKIKILETSKIQTPKFVYTSNINKNIFSLTIKDQNKYKVLPAQVRSIIYSPKTFLLFYDETVDGRTAPPSELFASVGGNFMPSVYQTDPFYMSGPTYDAGWTSGTAFGYITKKEILYSVQKLVDQGLTASSKGYAWLNFELPWEEYILFSSYTGPASGLDGISQGIASNFYGKLLKGGLGTDGNTFLGLKNYFPGISFGYYGQPRWPYYLLNSNIWTLGTTQINNIINFAADVWVGCTALADAVDVLMPSLYSVLNSPYTNKLHAEQNINLSKKINEKLESLGKSKKIIIPFISSVYYTDLTGTPYTIVVDNSAEFKYIPPRTIMLDSDSRYEAIEPIIQNGCDGLIIWNGTSYYTQIATRVVAASGNEDDPLGAGIYSWRLGPTAGVTNPWTEKQVIRQAISAHENYIKGVCMGITGNRWWWKAGSSTEVYTPTEWKPLGSNPAVGSTTSVAGISLAKNTITDAIYRQLVLSKTVLDEYLNQ